MCVELSKQQFPQKLSAVEQRQRLLYIGLVCLPLVISLINRWGIRLSLWGCPLVKWIGLPCMGWGLTRSFLATAQGDLAQAAGYHLFGPILFLGFAIAALHWTVELLRGRKIQTFYRAWLKQQRFWLFGFLLIAGYHLTRLISLQASGQLHHWFGASIVGQWF